MITEDLDIFLDDFGQEVVFNGTLTVKAIFDNAFYNTQLGDIDISTTLPRLTCKSSDVETISSKNTVVVSGTTYKVIELQPDGTGMTIITLIK